MTAVVVHVVAYFDTNHNEDIEDGPRWRPAVNSKWCGREECERKDLAIQQLIAGSFRAYTFEAPFWHGMQSVVLADKTLGVRETLQELCNLVDARSNL